MIFENKPNQPQITTENTKLSLVEIINDLDVGVSNFYALKLSALRQIDTKKLTHEQKKTYKKQYSQTHKLIVKSVRNDAYYPFISLPNYYHGKKIAKIMNTLNESDFKQSFVSMFYSYHEEEERGQCHSAINSIINYNSNNTTTFGRMAEEYLKLNHSLLWRALEEATLKRINAYSVKGRYQIYLVPERK